MYEGAAGGGLVFGIQQNLGQYSVFDKKNTVIC